MVAGLVESPTNIISGIKGMSMVFHLAHAFFVSLEGSLRKGCYFLCI